MAAVHKKKGGEIGITMVLWQSLRTHAAKFAFPQSQYAILKGGRGDFERNPA
jgi:hypothetical protein